jgi:hypothetical protein
MPADRRGYGGDKRWRGVCGIVHSREQEVGTFPVDVPFRDGAAEFERYPRTRGRADGGIE